MLAADLLLHLKLSPLQLRWIWADVLVRTPPAAEEELPPEQIWVLAFANLLQHLQRLTVEQRRLILEETADTLRAANPQHLLLLVFLDSQHVTLTGWTNFLDLQTGERIIHLDHASLESVSYNLTELFRRTIADPGADYGHLERRET
jgi:hypothetical protein